MTPAWGSYRRYRKNLIALNGKIPVKKNWRETFIPVADMGSHSGNMGWALGEHDLVVDVDPQNGGVESYEKLPCALQPTVTTPSGGFHVYLRIPDFVSYKVLRKKHPEFPGIDFLKYGNQCVIAGSATNTGQYQWASDDKFVQSEVPDDLLNMLVFTGKTESSTVELLTRNQMTSAEVVALLDKLDPSMTYDSWINVGMGLHHWNTDEGLELWDNWSKGGDTYKNGDCERHWRTFSVGSGITFSTVIYMAGQADTQTSQQYIEKIETCTSVERVKSICADIRNKTLTIKAINNIIKPLGEKIKSLTHKVHSEDRIRQLIDKNAANTISSSPSWCDTWVYTNSHCAFFNLATRQFYKGESFNVENGKNIPPSKTGNKRSAVKFVSDNGFVKIADTTAYMPTIAEDIIRMDDLTVLNTFNKNTVPPAAKSYTKQGEAAIKIVKEHARFLFGEDEYAETFLQWIAHNVQFPGVKIPWIPVVQSIQGAGKSFFSELLRECIGDKNVGVVSPSQVTSDFNGWAVNVTVNVFEELRIRGHNRYDVANAIKSLITDRMIQINEKGIKQYFTYNTTNYICFTNYYDALPIDDNDRRYWVVFAPIKSIGKMKEYTGRTNTEYFERLFNTLNHGAELRKFFLEYPITNEFKNTKRAPDTKYKRMMVATEDENLEGFTEVRDMINKGGKYYNAEIISQSELFGAAAMQHPQIPFTTRSRHLILRKLGFMAIPNKVRVGNKTHKIWARKFYTPHEIKDIFAGIRSDDDFSV